MSVRENVWDSIDFLISQEKSAAEFGRKIGVSRSQVGNWTARRNAPDIELINTIAKTYGVKLSDILNGNLGGKSIEVDTDHEFENVPVYCDIAAGVPMDMYPIDCMHPCPEYIRSRHPNGGWLRVNGDSYNQGGLPDGILAYIDFDMVEIVPDEPFAVCVNGDTATIKAVEIDGDVIRLIPNSYNPLHEPIVLDYSIEGTPPAHIMGQVVYASYPFNFEFR